MPVPDGLQGALVAVLYLLGFSARGPVMFFVRKKLYETVTTVMMLLISVGVFVLLNQHIPLWAAAVAAGAVLVASVWSGP